MTATPVAPVTTHPSAVQKLCAVCDGPPTWQVGEGDRSCDRCLALVLRAVLATRPFLPPLPTPLHGVPR